MGLHYLSWYFLHGSFRIRADDVLLLGETYTLSYLERLITCWERIPFGKQCNFLQIIFPTGGNIADSSNTQSIDIGAGKCLGVRRIFARILPYLPKKLSHYFRIKACWAPFLLMFSGVCSDFQGFYQGFHSFCPDFHGFFPDFHQIKIFWGALAPRAPPPPTQVPQRHKNRLMWIAI